MNITDFLGITVVGGLLSLLVEWAQGKFGTDSKKTKLLVIGLSVIVGGIYVALRDTALWGTIIGVLAASQTVYALFIKKS